MGHLGDILPFVTVLISLMAVIGMFVIIAIKIRKGGGSMTTVVLGATDRFLTKDRLRASETIVNENAGKRLQVQSSEGSEVPLSMKKETKGGR